MLNKALVSPNGIKLTFDTQSSANYWRRRVYRFRKTLQKIDAIEKSPYDHLEIHMDKTHKNILYITPRTPAIELEEL